MKPIPISAAKAISEKYDYDQVVIIGRAIGTGEHVTTYGIDKKIVGLLLKSVIS